jgi:hypothetical protein
MSVHVESSPEDRQAAAGDADAEPVESDIEVGIHAHFGMKGSFPLRIAELFFAADGLHIAEYGMVTPMFGLGMNKHHREAGAMKQVFEQYGIDEVLARADAVTWLAYDAIDEVVVSDGGRLGNPRIGVYTQRREAKAYRIHDDEFDSRGFVDALASYGSEYDIGVSHESGLGYRPVESLRRFFE